MFRNKDGGISGCSKKTFGTAGRFVLSKRPAVRTFLKDKTAVNRNVFLTTTIRGKYLKSNIDFVLSQVYDCRNSKERFKNMPGRNLKQLNQHNDLSRPKDLLPDLSNGDLQGMDIIEYCLEGP
jgi:hypothetical protein